MIKKFLDALDEDREYDFIANNYHHMRINELKDILLEYMYAIHREENEQDIKDQIRDSLTEREVFG